MGLNILNGCTHLVLPALTDRTPLLTVGHNLQQNRLHCWALLPTAQYNEFHRSSYQPTCSTTMGTKPATKPAAKSEARRGHFKINHNFGCIPFNFTLNFKKIADAPALIRVIFCFSIHKSSFSPPRGCVRRHRCLAYGIL